VKLGFLPTGVLGSRVEYAELVRWAADHGYQAADVPPRVPNAVQILRQAGLEPAAGGGVPPLIVADRETRQANVAQAIERLEAAAGEGIPIVMVNHARVADASDDDNFEYARLGYTPVAEKAAQLGLRLAIEHYPNYGRNLAINPASWRRLFELVPQPSLGLCFDPSHLVFLGIDYLRALREFGDRINYAHAKDTEIIPDGMYQYGFLGLPDFGRKPPGKPGWWRYTLPGYGQVNWGNYIGALLDVGYDGYLSVEHEDDLWGWRSDPARAMEGLDVARKYLSQFLPG
jgi:sugar phosphate isomerase/epimerase